MSDFRNNELRRLDLTVLLVFIGLLRHRKATEVAAEVALTQSAVSHALKRLREVFGVRDERLVDGVAVGQHGELGVGHLSLGS